MTDEVLQFGGDFCVARRVAREPALIRASPSFRQESAASAFARAVRPRPLRTRVRLTSRRAGKQRRSSRNVYRCLRSMHGNPIADLYYRRHHWDFRLGTYLGLLRTMSIRDMVAHLYSSSLLKTQTFTRLKRTRELIATLIVDGLDSARGQEALRRIQRAHQGVQASNDEYRYVLSVFFLEPLRFNELYGKKLFSEPDRKLLLEFWLQVGERLQIGELLPSLHGWLEFQRQFEAEHQGFTEQGGALARVSLDEVVRLVIPRGMQGLTRQALLGTMEPKVRVALGLPLARLPVAVSVNTLRFAAIFGAGTRVPTMDSAARS